MITLRYLILIILICTHHGLHPMGTPTGGIAHSVASILGVPLTFFLKTITLAHAGKEAIKSIQECVNSIEKIHSTSARMLWQEEEKESQADANRYTQEEEKLRAQPSLRAAQERMIAKASELALKVYSPSHTPLVRIQALFGLNRLSLLGYKGKIYRTFISIMNSHYFLSDGTLKNYDPSKCNNERPHRIHELIAFLKTFCKTKNEYLDLLKMGADLNIATFKERHTKEQGSDSWKEHSFDISTNNPVEPETIFANSANGDFLKVISCCESAKYPLAQKLIDRHRNKHSSKILCRPYEIMKRYCTEAQSVGVR